MAGKLKDLFDRINENLAEAGTSLEAELPDVWKFLNRSEYNPISAVPDLAEPLVKATPQKEWDFARLALAILIYPGMVFYNALELGGGTMDVGEGGVVPQLDSMGSTINYGPIAFVTSSMDVVVPIKGSMGCTILSGILGDPNYVDTTVKRSSVGIKGPPATTVPPIVAAVLRRVSLTKGDLSNYTCQEMGGEVLMEWEKPVLNKIISQIME